MNFGQRVVFWRKVRGMSQKRMTLELGWPSPSTLSKLERGQTAPTMEHLFQIAKALRLHPYFLIADMSEQTSLDVVEIPLDLLQRLVDQLQARLSPVEDLLTLMRTGVSVRDTTRLCQVHASAD